AIVWELGSDNTPRVQEEQLKIIHQICGEIKGGNKISQC
ncbi:unnamed protein product, partial [marine sediment metagenome]